MQHVFFKTQPILERIPISALETAPHFEEDEETLIDTTTVHSSELRRSIRLVPTSPNQQSRVSSSESGREIASNDILKSLQPTLQPSTTAHTMGSSLPNSHLNSLKKSPPPIQSKMEHKPEQKLETRPPLHPITTHNNSPLSTPSKSKGLIPAVSSPKKILGSLELMFQNLSNALAESVPLQNNIENLAQLSLKDHCQDHPKLFITKWIDYSNKYGLGFWKPGAGMILQVLFFLEITRNFYISFALMNFIK